jgi:hypothetical protein
MNAIAERSAELIEIEHYLEPSAHRRNACSVPPIIPDGPTLVPVLPKASDRVLNEQVNATEIPDSESAAEQLRIADSLRMIGDLVGAIDYAELALKDPQASESQRIQAENLIRLANIR